MKHLALFLFTFSSVAAYSQHEFQVWAEVGTTGKIVKQLDWSVDLNSRFGNSGLETFFPQVGLEYKVKKWFRPSIDYRYILDKDKHGNMLGGHRINVNANFQKEFGRFDVDGRLRYQYAFNRVINNVNFDPDLDQAFRFKGAVKYDIKKSKLSPVANAELFYDPQYGPSGPRFSKIRLSVGTQLNIKGPHKISVKYQVDKWFEYGKNLRHVMAFSYAHKL